LTTVEARQASHGISSHFAGVYRQIIGGWLVVQMIGLLRYGTSSQVDVW